MDDLLVILEGAIKIVKNFFPVFVFTVVGLAYIGWDEKKDLLECHLRRSTKQIYR